MSSPVLWYATRATGLVAMVLLTLSVVLGVLTATRFHSRNWPRFAQQSLHRRISILTLVFVAMHVLTSVLDTFVHIGWAAVVVPFASPYKRFWVGLGAIAFDLLIAVLVSSLLRNAIPERTWRGIHWLAYACWPVALVHGLGAGTDSWRTWSVALTLGCALSVLCAVLWRFGRPAAPAPPGAGVVVDPSKRRRPDPELARR